MIGQKAMDNLTGTGSYSGVKPDATYKMCQLENGGYQIYETCKPTRLRPRGRFTWVFVNTLKEATRVLSIITNRQANMMMHRRGVHWP